MGEGRRKNGKLFFFARFPTQIPEHNSVSHRKLSESARLTTYFRLTFMKMSDHPWLTFLPNSPRPIWRKNCLVEFHFFKLGCASMAKKTQLTIPRACSRLVSYLHLRHIERVVLLYRIVSVLHPPTVRCADISDRVILHHHMLILNGYRVVLRFIITQAGTCNWCGWLPTTNDASLYEKENIFLQVVTTIIEDSTRKFPNPVPTLNSL